MEPPPRVGAPGVAAIHHTSAADERELLAVMDILDLMRNHVPDALGGATVAPDTEPAFFAQLEARLAEIRSRPADAVRSVLASMTSEYAAALDATLANPPSPRDDFGDTAATIFDDSGPAPSGARAARRREARASGEAFAATVRRLVERRLRFLGLAQELLEEEGAHCDTCHDARADVLAYACGGGGERLCGGCDRARHRFSRAEARFALATAVDDARLVLTTLRPDEFLRQPDDTSPPGSEVALAEAQRALPACFAVVGACRRRWQGW